MKSRANCKNRQYFIMLKLSTPFVAPRGRVREGEIACDASK